MQRNRIQRGGRTKSVISQKLNEERVSGRRKWSAGPDAAHWASKRGLRFDHWI